MLKNIFGSKREGVTGDGRKVPNEGLSWLILLSKYYLGDQIKDTKMGKLCVIYGGQEKLTLPFVEKTEGGGKKTLGRS
jgi:hypothetical protein